MDFKRTKPLTVFLIVIVAAIWANGIRVFFQAMSDDDVTIDNATFSEASGTNQTKKKRPGLVVAETGYESASVHPTADEASQTESQDLVKEKRRSRDTIALRIMELSQMDIPERNPFQAYRKIDIPPIIENDSAVESEPYEEISIEELQESDPGPGIQLIGVILGAKAVVMVISDSGEKVLLREQQKFGEIRVTKISARTIEVVHNSSRRYLLDESGWRILTR